MSCGRSSARRTQAHFALGAPKAPVEKSLLGAVNCIQNNVEKAQAASTPTGTGR